MQRELNFNHRQHGQAGGASAPLVSINYAVRRYPVKLERWSWIASIIAAIFALVSIVWGVWTYFKPLETPQVTTVTLTNQRYGFKGNFPADWARHDPENGDGFGFVNSKDKDVSISVSGGYLAFLDLKKDDEVMEKYKEFIIKAISEEGGKIKDEIQFGMMGEESKKRKTDTVLLPGYRVQYIVEEEGRKFQVIHVMTAFNDDKAGVCFNIYCKAPMSSFSSYEKIFVNTISNFRVLFPWQR